MVALFERKGPMPEKEGVRDVQMDPSYRAWLESNPSPGEVFVDKGEASAADSRKLRWSPSKAQREMIKVAIAHEVESMNRLYQEDAQDSYADHIEGLVQQTLRNVGVDPATLKPLPDADGSASGSRTDPSA
jgi:hypothetical protein